VNNLRSYLKEIVAAPGLENGSYEDHWEDKDVGGWTILKLILEREDGMEWIGLIWLRIGTSVGLL
jgi:hypothetical protein